MAFAICLLPFAMQLAGRAQAATGCDGVGNCYIRAGATGTRTGADWTNAYASLPATLVRGCTYYVAAGTYPGYVFNTPDSGTARITIQAPTIANHGTSAGWNSSYVGQATFTCSSGCAAIWNFTSDYWVMNGAYRSNYTTGYGFHVYNSNGDAGEANIEIGSEGGPYYHDVTIAYVESEGSHPTSDSSPGVGTYTFESSGGSYDVLVDHDYMHDGYTSYFIKGNHGHNGGGAGYGPGNNITIQYSYSLHAYDSANYHGEACSCSEGLQNFTIRYSYFIDAVNHNGGTGYIATASGAGYNTGNQENGPWYIYGNVFEGQATGGNSACAVGDDTLDFFDVSFNPGGDLYILNNTYANLGQTYCGGGQAGYAFGSGYRAQMAKVVVENEVWYHSSTFNQGANGGTFTNTGYTFDYNQYYQMADSSASNDPGAHSVITSGSNPFTNPTAFDFSLASNTNAGIAVSNVGTYWAGTTTAANTFDVDMNGVTRGANGTWDRGALQISTGGGNPPVITSPLTSSGTVGVAYSYQITATNSPTSFNATGLPAGLSVDTATGLISGMPTSTGTYNVSLSAINASGTGTATLALTLYPACDVNQDRLTNVVDVQLEVNMALGVIPCTGDINKDGVCNVVDVQRVVNAALGGACVSP